MQRSGCEKWFWKKHADNLPEVRRTVYQQGDFNVAHLG